MTPDAPAAPESGRILVLVAHPDLRHSRINRRLLAAARGVAAEQAGRVRVHDLYAMYPDFGIDIQAEQAALDGAGLIVWQHPLHWYGMPPMMKLWLDEVLREGWAHGDDARGLRGKQLWAVLSAGGSAASYQAGGANQAPLDTYLAPYRQVAALCGLGWHAPQVVYGAAELGDAALDALANAYADRLRRWPDWHAQAGAPWPSPGSDA